MATLIKRAKAYTESNISDEKLYESVQSYQSLVATLCGLITGFSYVVLSDSKQDYEKKSFLGSDRSNVQAGFSIFAFTFSLGTFHPQ